MNKFLFAIILISISSVFNSNKPFIDGKIYELVSEELCSVYEYGIKIEYTTDNSSESELYKYREVFGNVDLIDSENNLINLEEVLGDKVVTLNIIKENDLTRVSIQIISKSYINIEEIKKKFDEENKQDVKFYTYIKGEITENKSNKDIEQNLLDVFRSEGEIEVQKMLLDKGTTGVINLKRSYQFNYSIMTYEENRVLILGSPIIFTTY